jgi:hypothetical protein
LKWKDIYVGTGSLHIGDATLSSTGTTIIFNGDLIPSSTNTFSVGSVDNLVKSIHIGPGTVVIGPTGTLGNDPNGIIYAEYGLAAPTIALGASIPGTTGPVEGGVRLTLSGTTGPIQYQHIGPGGIVDGPIRTLLTEDSQNTGPTGPSMSFQLGNNPYATGGNLITTTIETAETRIYEVGPITTTASTKLLIMANASFISNNSRVIMNVGRATTSGATAANSTNIVSGTTPVTLPTTTPSYYMAATSEANNHESNTNGFAIDAPGAGTFYYTIWMSSSSSHNYSEMTAVLTALQIT